MIGKIGKFDKKTLILNFVGGALTGGVAAFLVLEHGERLDLEGAHPLGLLVAALLGIVGAAILITSLTRAGAAEMIGTPVEPGEDIGVELKSLRLQGAVALLAAAELLILSLGTDLLTGPESGLLLAVLAVVLAAQTWLNLRLWRSGDELFRRVIVEAAVIGFVAFQFLLFLWVVAARFALTPDPEALDIYVLMMVLYLAGSGIAGVRRGYGSGC